MAKALTDNGGNSVLFLRSMKDYYVTTVSSDGGFLSAGPFSTDALLSIIQDVAGIDVEPSHAWEIQHLKEENEDLKARIESSKVGNMNRNPIAEDFAAVPWGGKAIPPENSTYTSAIRTPDTPSDYAPWAVCADGYSDYKGDLEMEEEGWTLPKVQPSQDWEIQHLTKKLEEMEEREQNFSETLQEKDREIEALTEKVNAGFSGAEEVWDSLPELLQLAWDEGEVREGEAGEIGIFQFHDGSLMTEHVSIRVDAHPKRRFRPRPVSQSSWESSKVVEASTEGNDERRPLLRAAKGIWIDSEGISWKSSELIDPVPVTLQKEGE